jgi:hypothetical protein
MGLFLSNLIVNVPLGQVSQSPRRWTYYKLLRTWVYVDEKPYCSAIIDEDKGSHLFLTAAKGNLG